MKRRKAFTREEKLLMITQVFLTGYTNGQMDYTTAEIASALDVSASTQLRRLLDHLIQQEVLKFTDEPHIGIANFRRLYRLSEAYIEYAAKPVNRRNFGKPRELRINSKKGSFVEVLR